MLDIFRSINELLENKEGFCLATILEKSGSAPREEGAKMIVRKDFSIIGTVGGGLLEALTIKFCKDIFENKCSIVKKFNLSNSEAMSLGMVCGGELKVLIEYIDADDLKIVDIYSKLYELKERNVRFILVSKLSEKEDEYFHCGKWICTETDFFGDENDEIQEAFKRIRENFNDPVIGNLNIAGNNYLIETIMNDETVYIFGAGHVSQKLSYITKMVDFKTVVLDDRIEFANRDRFKNADDVIVMASFNNICDYIKVNKESYLIIVTRGHAFDKDVLAQALKTDAKYIGMIGSKTKREFVYNLLIEEGFTKKDLERVHSPIGLDIYAETPEEIAVSIAAELIKVRREAGHEK